MTELFLEFASEIRRQVDDSLDELLPAAEKDAVRLHEAMRYSVFAGGKRVRPVLVVMAGEAFGVDRAQLLPAAAALEMVHTFSLVHDDLPALDDDDLRRGRPTAHKQYDEATAVLVGDALLNRGLEVVMERPEAVDPAIRLDVSRLLARAIGTFGMIGGQMADLEAEQQWPENPEQALESIHRRKTGALLTVALRMGGAYASVDGAARELLDRLGERIGLMFQMADDILDVEGNSETLGKTAGKDQEAEKLTYPSLFGLAQSREMLQSVGAEAVELAAQLPRSQALFVSLIDYLCRRDR